MKLVLDILNGIAIWVGILFIAAWVLVALEWVLDMWHKRKK
jgi:hypothetical protein